MAIFKQCRTLSAHGPAIPALRGQSALLPVKLTGTEGINDLFTYQLEFETPASPDLTLARTANFALDAFLGQELTLAIELDGNSHFRIGMPGGDMLNAGPTTREICGLITSAQWLNCDDQVCRYQLTLRPWLHVATLNCDCRIYQNQNVIEILDALLGRYTYPVSKRLIERYPKRDYQTQFNESDYQFFCRLCEEWGINWFFEHSDNHHRLVLTDYMRGHQPNPSAYQHIPLFPTGHKIDQEYLRRFIPVASMCSDSYTASDYDYTRPGADLSISSSDPDHSAPGQREVYQWHVDSHFSQPKAGADNHPNDSHRESEFLARLRLESLRQDGRGAHGAGALRGMVPGCSFALRHHPYAAANIDYLITSTTLLIVDVAQTAQAQVPEHGYQVHVEFDAYPLNRPWRPQRRTAKPVTRGPQTAVVVGPDEHSIWTDKYGRIKVQFPWDRCGKSNQNSSCWIRVCSPAAGNQMGSMQVPRIGQEVIIDFIGGDPDLPICIGSVYNENNQPPWLEPGYSALSGMRSRELIGNRGNAAAGRSNHLILDDTQEQIQAQIKSDHLHSQLSLGYITRIEDHQGRQEARGEGFELRTDGAGVLRAQDGMLISTQARSAAQGPIKAMDETVKRLTHAGQLQQQLAELATRQAVQDDSDQQSVAASIDEQNQALQGNPAARSGAPAAFPELAAPHLVLASAAGIASTCADSTHIASGRHTALSSVLHTSLAVGKNFLVSAGQHIRLFADFGMRLVARRGKVEIAAQDDDIELIARKVIALMADDEIVLHSKKGIRFATDGAISLSAKQGVQVFTDGRYEVYSAGYQSFGPQALPAKTWQWRHCDYDQEVVLKRPDGSGAPRRALEIINASSAGRGTSLHTDEQGSSKLMGSPGVHGYTFIYKGPQP